MSVRDELFSDFTSRSITSKRNLYVLHKVKIENKVKKLYAFIIPKLYTWNIAKIELVKNPVYQQNMLAKYNHIITAAIFIKINYSEVY